MFSTLERFEGNRTNIEYLKTVVAEFQSCLNIHLPVDINRFLHFIDLIWPPTRISILEFVLRALPMIYTIKYVKKFATDEYTKFIEYMDRDSVIDRNYIICVQHLTLIGRVFMMRAGLSSCTLINIKTLILLDTITYEDIVLFALETQINKYQFLSISNEFLADNITDIKLFESYTKILSTHPSNKEFLQYIFAHSYFKYCKQKYIKFEDPQELNSIREAIKIFELSEMQDIQAFGLVNLVDKQQFSNAEEVINFIVSIVMENLAYYLETYYKECIPFIFSTSTMLMITDNDIKILESKIDNRSSLFYREGLLRNMKLAKAIIFDRYMTIPMKLIDTELATV
jgi:hypothetical protein